MRKVSQPALLPDALPEGFVYQPGFLHTTEHDELLRHIAALNFEAFDFHGYIAKRRVVEYGFAYDFGSRKTSAAQPIPDFQISLRNKAARFSGLVPEDLVEAVVTEYPPGAPIGWHRDVPQFETIIGISLAGSARMRLKPYRSKGKIQSVILEPGSM